MDNDFHKIVPDDKIINQLKPILFGNNIWIGCRCLILKDVSIEDGCVVGAGTVIRKNVLNKKCVVCGADQRIVKENVTWYY